MPRTKLVSLPTGRDLCAVGLAITRTVTDQISRNVNRDPERYLEAHLVGKRLKKALNIDVDAENTFEQKLHTRQNGRFAAIRFYGEESLRDEDLDLTGQSGIVALVDAVDGTDLVARGLGNWCTASLFYAPQNEPGKRILAAFVGTPTGAIYYAIDSEDRAYVKYHDELPRRTRGASGVTTIKDASIYFYGQKAPNMLAVSKLRFFPNCARIHSRHKRQHEDVDLRLYNLGGIPMMCKLVDQPGRHIPGVDAVFDVEGQKPHDVVAGAFIAKRGGACLTNLQGKPIEIEDLETALLKPASKETEMRYILAATPELAESLRKALHLPASIK